MDELCRWMGDHSFFLLCLRPDGEWPSGLLSNPYDNSLVGLGVLFRLSLPLPPPQALRRSTCHLA